MKTKEKRDRGIIGLLLFLLGAAFFLAMFNPAYSIFPLFLLFILGVGLFFRSSASR